MSGKKSNYHIYVNSFQWKKKSEDALLRAGYVCENCGQEGDNVIFNVHHLNYQNLGNEKPEDLIVLCEVCHYSVHNNDLKPNRKFGRYHINMKDWGKDIGWKYGGLTSLEYNEGMKKYSQYLDEVGREYDEGINKYSQYPDQIEREKENSKFDLWMVVILIILLGVLLTIFR